MEHDNAWVYHDPRWWIDQIAIACSPEYSGSSFAYPVDEYFTGLKDRLAGTLRYLSAHRTLDAYEVRRSLFFAKALKKWRLPLDTIGAGERVQNAVDGFCARNSAAASDAYIPIHVECMKYLLSRWLPEIPTDGIHGRFGPGAVAEGWAHPQRFCRLADWLSLGLPWDALPGAHHDADQSVARLAAVPKDWDKDRLITVESCYSSYVQQLVRSVLLESIHSGPLKGTAMDLGYTDGQAIQRRLALGASRTGRYATIDLSDASDSVSWAAVQAVFPQWVCDLLWASRSHAFTHKSVFGGTPQRTYMFAGMGNATTFVVETLFFSAYAVAVQMAHPCKRPWVSTFGDDIIVTSEACEWLLEEGDPPFFKINRSKSFLGSDALRESCGIFAHNGHDVTVPKVDGYLQSYEGALGIADLHRRLSTSQDAFQVVLASAIAKVGLLDNWPFRVEGYPSLCDWTAEFSALPETRVNPRYQRREAKVIIPSPAVVRYPTTDFISKLDVDTNHATELSVRDFARECSREIVARRRRERYPEANVWYQARLLGLVESVPVRITRERDAGRDNCFVAFPVKEKVTQQPRWARILVDQA